MKKILLLLTFMAIFSCAQAQNRPYHPYYLMDTINDYPAEMILKFSYLSLLDFKQSIQFAFEYKVKPRVTFQNELGYIHPIFKDIHNYDLYKNMRGVRTRFETRFYQRNRFRQVDGFYLAPEIFFVHTKYSRVLELQRSCADGGCDFIEYVGLKITKNVLGYHFKLGYQTQLSDKFVLDFYGGLGARHVFIHNLNKEVVESTIRNGFWFVEHNKGRFIRPSMALGIKMGYVIK